jgi:NAD(P)-dependent dehydrogenase (short-subunit alcohol dehydrogenase family)
MPPASAHPASDLKETHVNIDFTGRTVLVTGSTLGVGLATAEAFARAGARTVVNGRDESRLKAAAERIRTVVPGAELVTAAADVATAEGAQALMEAVPEVDVLVNNTGIFASTPVLEIEDAEWRRFFEVNVLSGVRLARQYMPGMMARGHGRVVFVSSEAAVDTPLDMVHYGMTKTALLAVAKGLATAAAGTGVTVNSVLPGPTHTEGIEEYITAMFPKAENFDAAQREFMTRVKPTSLIQRLIEPAEVANMILFTSSDLASATTGAALKAEGGIITSIVP